MLIIEDDVKSVDELNPVQNGKLSKAMSSDLNPILLACNGLIFKCISALHVTTSVLMFIYLSESL
ncbi:hypothetical protein FACS189496_4470 [Bacilli bacterium]|nr:hypothetical protein FACS189496_4470 [Bacilli bacterium]